MPLSADMGDFLRYMRRKIENKVSNIGSPNIRNGIAKDMTA